MIMKFAPLYSPDVPYGYDLGRTANWIAIAKEAGETDETQVQFLFIIHLIVMYFYITIIV
ncbi:hypothetical protein XBFM1_420003 [Xenorhabdus bovienii str. feltiae Moldova]|uniref:Uncharacterized protein n=1 Tax=Xenorhabdus bovienii str. feltiae Moldova TaxID=1398200 RepID=A0A077NV82_XENBV|nr:hypothetical protein XBFM1_420003 [Xenorhabdus bovienii str. feltiae Moldova]